MWGELCAAAAAGFRNLATWLFLMLLTSLGVWSYRDSIAAWVKGLLAPPAIEAPANGKPDDGWEKGTVVQPELQTK